MESVNPQRPLLLGAFLVFLLVTMVWILLGARDRWSQAQGYEMEMIAQSLVDGHGFSFNVEDRWLFRPREGLHEYAPTAWQEPVYPLLIGAAFRFLGARGRLAIVVGQVVFLVLTSVTLYFLGRLAFTRWTGVLAGSLLVLLPSAQEAALNYLSNAMLSGLMISIAACLALRALREPSVPRGVLLGAVLGFSALTHAATLALVPAACLLLVVSSRPFRPLLGKTALATLLTAVAVVSPWAVRNWAQFGRLVPVRTGLGFNTYLGNPILAETFLPRVEACPGGGPPWRARDAVEAIVQSRSRPERMALFDRAVSCVERLAVPGYGEMNEAERDGVYLRAGLRFVLLEPASSSRLACAKAVAFFYSGWTRSLRLIALLAAAGCLITLPRAAPRILVAFTVAFAASYVVGLPCFYRYRYPVEPLLLLLACHAPVTAGMGGARWFRRWVERPAP